MLKRNLKSILCVPTLLILTTFLVASCSSVKKIEIASVAIERVPLELPHVDPLILEHIEWYIVSEENVDKVMAELERKGYDAVVFGLSDKGYEILALNIAKIKQLTEQQKAKLEAYEKYYQSQNQKLDEMAIKQQDKIDAAKKKNKEADSKGMFDGITKLFGGKK